MNKIKRIFIANRGEIARRITQTAYRMGIETVVIKGEGNPPLYLLDTVTEFISVENESSALYLDAEKMIQFAKDYNCDAVHPGFGFLSENAGFAKRVVEKGLSWIGPTSDVISTMASKSNARDIALEAGVTCIDGLQGFEVPKTLEGDFTELESFAKKAGYPLLLKAALGGGGKGMRLVRKEEELKEAAFRAHSEALNSFGDGELICERYVEFSRHVEVQILADKHGNVVAIGDRDCSIQRRHQKILEEAPAPGLHPETRKKIHESAVNLAKKVGYQSAGTVEFLLEWNKGVSEGEEQSFFFLEMNTRLQVEHPVTEEVYGIDLVEWQLRVANGEQLPCSFTKMEPKGHSIEARLYAEDVVGDFFPAPGRVASFLPAYGPGIRWEIGLDEVDEISPAFDPMFAKAVAYGETRDVAIERLVLALKQTIFAGPANNLEFLATVCEHTEFAKKPMATNFFDKTLQTVLELMEKESSEVESSAEALLDQIEKAQGNLRGDSLLLTTAGHSDLTNTAFQKKGSRRSHGSDENIVILSQKLLETKAGNDGSVLSGQGLYTPEAGKTVRFCYAYTKYNDENYYWVFLAGKMFSRTTIGSTWGGVSSESPETAMEVLAPVPGKVVKVSLSKGDEIKVSESIFVLESMKMEFEVKAARSGKVSSVLVKEGDQVMAGDRLATWED